MSTNGCCRGLPASVCAARPYGCGDGPPSEPKSSSVEGEEPVALTERCDGQLCYYHGCQCLPGCVQGKSAPRPSPAVSAEVTEAVAGLKRIVEEIDGAITHGTWRDDHGTRLKDTPEWVALYNAITGASLAPNTDLAGCKIALEQAWASNREREVAIEKLKKVLQAVAEEFVTIELRLRANETERALGAVMCGQRDIAHAIAKAEIQS